MASVALRADRIISAVDANWLLVADGTIVDVGSGDPPGPATDLGDAILAPGFIDIQINGIGSVDFARTDAAGYRTAQQRLLAHGVTTFLPTLISAPLNTFAPAIDVLKDAGAFGVHLEGPFLGGAPGAHDPKLLVPASVDWVSEMLARFPGFIRVVTLAPEADPSADVTRTLHRGGVVVSLGHSTASYDEAISFADAGARAVTHLFNGMGPLHHREPGLAGAALDDDRLTPTLIADLVHVHPVALRLAASRKRNVALISDAIAIDAPWAASRGVREVDGAPRLPDGTLAGSILTMDHAVQNMVRIGVNVERAIEMASTIPAELLGLDDRGIIEPGKRADLVALDPADLSVRAVWKDGAQTH